MLGHMECRNVHHALINPLLPSSFVGSQRPKQHGLEGIQREPWAPLLLGVWASTWEEVWGAGL